MIYPKDRNIHRPLHIHQNRFYFITASTVDRDKLLKTAKRKKIFWQVLCRSIRKFQTKLYAWVILDDHYHLLVEFRKEKDLSKFVQNLHTNSSRLLNQIDKKSERKIWYQYWDRCVRSDKDFWTFFNYIHHNPVKHRYSKTMRYQFSSYNYWLKRKGREWLDSCFELYPIKDFSGWEK